MKLPVIKHLTQFIEENDQDYIIETIEVLEMVINGERQVGKEPALWETIHIIFKFKGTMTKERAEKACALSIDKYCSVAATLIAAGAKITWTVEML